MTQFSDHRHADLSHELTKLSALADLAEEWCDDLGEVSDQETPQGPAEALPPAQGSGQEASSFLPAQQVQLI